MRVVDENRLESVGTPKLKKATWMPSAACLSPIPASTSASSAINQGQDLNLPWSEDTTNRSKEWVEYMLKSTPSDQIAGESAVTTSLTCTILQLIRAHSSNALCACGRRFADRALRNHLGNSRIPLTRGSSGKDYKVKIDFRSASVRYGEEVGIPAR